MSQQEKTLLDDYRNGYIDFTNEELVKLVSLISTSGLGDLVKAVRNQSEEFQLAIINLNSDVIRYLRNPSEKVQLLALEKDPDNITLFSSYSTYDTQKEFLKYKLRELRKNPPSKKDINRVKSIVLTYVKHYILLSEFFSELVEFQDVND
jgi:hypothetical protein